MPQYAELHAHSNFSFLDGASHPEELVAEAARLGLAGLALTDHDGFYGIVRFAEAALHVGLPTIFGAELTLGLSRRQNGIADPEGEHLVVLAKSPEGYARLSRVIAEGQLAGKTKGKPRFDLENVAQTLRGHCLVLTGCRKGAVPRALVKEGPQAAGRCLDALIAAFGQENVLVELWHHNEPIDDVRNDGLNALAISRHLAFVATTNAHYADPKQFRLACALAAIRARRSLSEINGWLPAGPSAHLRSAEEQLQRFRRFPGSVERTADIAADIAFDLRLVVPGLPPYPTPNGESEMQYLRTLTEQGAVKRYGTRDAEQVPGAWKQIDYELGIIESLGFPGYFLIVWDMVEYARKQNIYCQGRGSAANSAVCFALGVTRADAVRLGLIFERFLSTEREGLPDIDVDFESGRREEVIQYVYERYGRHHAAQVANVISYRSRSALRDAGKALGYPAGAIDAMAKGIEGRHHDSLANEDTHTTTSRNQITGNIPADVAELAAKIEHFPRHLGIHSGGMVLCNRPVIDVCPVEWASMPGRTVLQWDKDDCAVVGLTKFDMLGLGMLEALHRTVDLITDFDGTVIDLAEIPQEDAVYEMMTRADTIGVFQIESRAQMGTLPRLKPKEFYDLVIEIALIRPGPIQGGSVHPYLRRRNNEEPVTYLHPLLEKSLKKTLGIPLFQEQLMQMAIDVAGFTPTEADQLRQAMSSKRSRERMEQLRTRFYEGMAKNAITGEVADEIFSKMAAFADFGFPESHSVSFAYLAYASTWLKLHHPAAFLAGLLNSQPMGFYSPATLVADARRHGVTVLRCDVNNSAVNASLVQTPDAPNHPAVRMGLSSIKSVGEPTAERIMQQQPFCDLEDFTRRTACNKQQLEALASAGALDCLEPKGRREALWAVGAYAATSGPDRIGGLVVGATSPSLPKMSPSELVVADLVYTGVATESSLMELVREHLDEHGVITASALRSTPDGTRVLVAGVVTHRQRPETARGVTFINLEDETGLVNVVVSVGAWKRYQRVAQRATAMVIRGKLEARSEVVNVVAEKIEALELAIAMTSRDFH